MTLDSVLYWKQTVLVLLRSERPPSALSACGGGGRSIGPHPPAKTS